MFKEPIQSHWTVLATICGVFFLLSGGIWFATSAVENAANPKVSSRSISVTGDGRSLATPDLATVMIGYSSNNESFAKATESARAYIEKVRTEATKQGVEPEYISETQYGGQGTSANGSINITFENPKDRSEHITAFLDAVLETPSPKDAGAQGTSSYLNNICLGFSDLAAAQQEGRTAALQAAEAKAQDLAAQAGKRLGRLVSMTDNSMTNSSYGAGYGNNCYGLSTLNAKNISAQPIFANINATFELK